MVRAQRACACVLLLDSSLIQGVVVAGGCFPFHAHTQETDKPIVPHRTHPHLLTRGTSSLLAPCRADENLHPSTMQGHRVGEETEWLLRQQEKTKGQRLTVLAPLTTMPFAGVRHSLSVVCFAQRRQQRMKACGTPTVVLLLSSCTLRMRLLAQTSPTTLGKTALGPACEEREPRLAYSPRGRDFESSISPVRRIACALTPRQHLYPLFPFPLPCHT